MAPDADTLSRWQATLRSYSGDHAAAARTLAITEDELRRWCPPVKSKASNPARRNRR